MESVSERCVPVAGRWYKNEQGKSFEVIGIDREDGMVELQYFDGTIEELPLERWRSMGICPRQPPEDCLGPFRSSEVARRGGVEEPLHPTVWSGPLDSADLEPDRGD